jgi:hypothetical protein
MGTMPYMAVDLLEPTPTKHLYRYDLESLFYVFAVLVTRYDRGEVIENPPLQNWFELPPSSLRPKKVTFLCKLPAQPTSAFENLDDFLLCMGLMFRAGYEAQDNHLLSVRGAKNPKSTLVDRKAILNSKFNYETLEGNVDFDKFQTLLNDLNTVTQAWVYSKPSAAKLPGHLSSFIIHIFCLYYIFTKKLGDFPQGF